MLDADLTCYVTYELEPLKYVTADRSEILANFSNSLAFTGMSIAPTLYCLTWSLRPFCEAIFRSKLRYHIWSYCHLHMNTKPAEYLTTDKGG